MAWMNIFETGCHCPVEPCARNCPSSVVYHGSAGRLHCGFLICQCCLRWCEHDFLLWWIWIRPVEFSRLRLFLVTRRRGEMWGPSEQWKPQDSSWMEPDGRKMEKRSGSREHALGRLVGWFTVRVSESFIKYRPVVVVMVDHHVAWRIQTKLDGWASIISEAHMCCVRRETTYNES